MISRRRFLKTLTAAGGIVGLSRSSRAQSSGIDRVALVSRHNPVLRQVDPLSPLTVGNGEFAFTADVTGLQTLLAEYENAMPLCTMSQWGWHTQPADLDSKKLRLTPYETHGRNVDYATSSDGQTELYQWLRENPHRLHLGRIGFCRANSGKEIQASELAEIKQELDLWRGAISSSFRSEGKPVTVQTAVHPRQDVVAVSIRSPLISDSTLAVRFEFPYASSSMQAADWQQKFRHQTIAIRKSDRIDIRRTLHHDKYFVAISWEGDGIFAVPGPQVFLLSGTKGRLDFVVAFARDPIIGELPTAKATFAANLDHWRRFWTEGGAVELAQSKDPRALELERRVVLSQYLTAVQCSGSKPPQETGLTVNSWYGKFHLEMHWWHAAHFALWNRLPLLEKSLGWYDWILPEAQKLAQSQGYAGARWPKMVGPDGRDSPSPIGPLLIWQQPHPIFYAELCYQSRRDRKTLAQYSPLVFESANFMASYAFWEEAKKRYVLGPPLIPAQENHPPRETWNPTFELAYWKYGLKTAQRWREQLGLPPEPKWEEVIRGLSALPVADGVYLAHENCPQTFSSRNYDHPSMLGAYGVLPGDGVDRETIRRTLFKTMKEWKWDQTWGWDYPMTAMTAARLGEPGVAVDALLMQTEKNRYLPNGHNWQRADLPCYLPGNGGLLYAVAMMAGGWQDAPRKNAPGFPEAWTVRSEGLNSSLLEKI